MEDTGINVCGTLREVCPILPARADAVPDPGLDPLRRPANVRSNGDWSPDPA